MTAAHKGEKTHENKWHRTSLKLPSLQLDASGTAESGALHGAARALSPGLGDADEQGLLEARDLAGAGEAAARCYRRHSGPTRVCVCSSA